jgi:arylsulfatase A-like enzyme
MDINADIDRRKDRTAMAPNLILIVIDDLGWRDLTCYGSTFYETPRLDHLAAEGMRFTDAYAASPVCSPSRASLMSGKCPARVGVTQWIGGYTTGKLCDVPYFGCLPSHEFSLASALREGGYSTWHVGKWHLGDSYTSPEKHGFEVNRGGCGWGLPHRGYFSPYGLPTLTDGPPGEYLTDRLTDEAIALIRGRDQAKPFFLNLWHYSVHSPHQAPQPLIEKYRNKAAVLGLDQQQALVAGEPFPCLHLRGENIQRRVLQSHPVYAAMVERLDWNIGRVLDALAEQGIAEDTLLVFTSDNGGVATAEGWPTCNLPLAEGKGWMYEGGTRVCQIARWPGTIAPGSECSTPTTGCDWYPTFLAAAGLPLRPSQHVDGVDLVPLLRGAGEPQREGIFWHYPHYSNQGGSPACAVRRGDWKLIEFFEDGRLELYDLRRDLGERRDLAAEQPGIVRDLHARLRAWRVQVEAMIPKPNPNWVPLPVAAGVDGPEV